VEHLDFAEAGEQLGLTTRQIRERWNLYLDPKIKTRVIRKAMWTADEDAELMLLRYQHVGWPEIGRKLQATQYQAKTRYAKLMKFAVPEAPFVANDEPTEPIQFTLPIVNVTLDDMEPKFVFDDEEPNDEAYWKVTFDDEEDAKRIDDLFK
jgi:hypothetical protein